MRTSKKIQDSSQIDNYQFERKLYEEGYTLICGTDEVGRGPLVGPVVAAAVIMPKDVYIEGVTDSKKLTDKKRRMLDAKIKEKALAYSIYAISNVEIDEINIYQASKKAMIMAINNLSIKPEYVLSDAMKLEFSDILNLPIIKGDLKSFSIGCASIIAKVARDDYMDQLHQKYPMYRFDKNKGYPTKDHLKAIEEYGVIEEHRKTYKPVKNKLMQQLSIFDFIE